MQIDSNIFSVFSKIVCIRIFISGYLSLTISLYLLLPFKSVDKDGTFTYSSICVVNFSATDNIISISPNPVTNLLRIETSPGEALLANSATTTIHIYSPSIQLMQSIKITRADRNVVTIDVDMLAKRVHFLQFVNADGVRTAKFIKE